MGKIEYIIASNKSNTQKNDFRNIKIPFEVLGYLRNPIFFKRIFFYTNEI